MEQQEKQVDLRPAVQAAIGRAVAMGDVPDEVIQELVARLTDVHSRFPIRWLDICNYGTCVDYFVKPDELAELVGYVFGSDLSIRKVEVFPWGIPPFTDLVQVRFEHQDELAQFVKASGRRQLFDGDPDGSPA
jgi:hypothetical protein